MSVYNTISIHVFTSSYTFLTHSADLGKYGALPVTLVDLSWTWLKLIELIIMMSLLLLYMYTTVVVNMIVAFASVEI